MVDRIDPSKHISANNFLELKQLLVEKQYSCKIINKQPSQQQQQLQDDEFYKTSPLKKLSKNFNKCKTEKNNSKLEFKMTTLDLTDKENESKLISLIKKSSKRLKPLSENAYEFDDKSSRKSHDSEASDDSIDANIEIPLDSEIRIENPEFDDNLSKYYISANENITGNYDIYITNCLKLISCFQPHKDFNKEILEKKQIIKTMDITWSKDKKLIVLDLDETLIHSDLDCKFKAHDEYIKVNPDKDDESIIPINFRPHVFEFLDFCSEYFDVAIFTASCKDYADAILDRLEKNKKYFKYRFYRGLCINYNNIFIKNLSILGKSHHDILIVDNCLLSFSHDLKNGILVTSFFSDSYDTDLPSLIEFFQESIINAKDVRNIIEETFEFDQIREKLKDYKE